MTDTVLVTGATGFVAGWCIVDLLQQGHSVRATVRRPDAGEALRKAINRHAPTDRLTFVVADLTSDAGWAEAMRGCTAVMHVASPLGSVGASEEAAYTAAARDGTLRLLRFAVAAKVRRVVMTSAAAAARPPLTDKRPSDETMWADPADPQFDVYRRSKIRSERAAWEFMRDHPETEFVTVLPGAVFGPPLRRENLGSLAILRGLVEGKPRFLPRLGLWVTDVRDLAAAHVQALVRPEAAGQRFIVAGQFMWMAEIAQELRRIVGPERARNVPTLVMPTFVARLMAPFVPQIRSLAPLLGRRFEIDTSKARTVLGYRPRPVADTLAASVADQAA